MKKVFNHLKWFFIENKYTYLALFTLLLFISIIQVFPAKFLGLIIDKITEGSLTATSLVLLICGLFGFPLLKYFLNRIYHYNIHRLGHDLLFKLREKYISHLFELDNETYEK